MKAHKITYQIVAIYRWQHWKPYSYIMFYFESNSDLYFPEIQTEEHSILKETHLN